MSIRCGPGPNFPSPPDSTDEIGRVQTKTPSIFVTAVTFGTLPAAEVIVPFREIIHSLQAARKWMGGRKRD